MASIYENQVYTMFVGYFGRPPAPSGLQYYTDLMDQSGGNWKIIVDDFWNSEESQSLYTQGSTEAKVNAVFNQLFGRDAAVEGLNYWTNQVQTGQVSLPELTYVIANNAAEADRAVVDAKVDASKAMVAEMDTTDEILAFQNNLADAREALDGVKSTADAEAFDAAAVVAQIVDDAPGGSGTVGDTFTLTAGTDNLTGTANNDTFVADYDVDATKQTLSNLDTIDGGNGTDTIQLSDDTAAVTLPSTITVTNVENFVANVSDNLTADVSGWEGLTSVDAQIVGGNLVLTAASGIDVTAGNVDGTVDVTNAATVTIEDADATSVIAIETGSVTTSVSVTGGDDIEIDQAAAVADDADLSDDANSTTLESVSIDGSVGSARIESDALTSLSLANLETAGESFVVDNANPEGHDLTLDLDNVGYDEDGAAVANVYVDDATADKVNVRLASNSNIHLIADVATELSVAGAGLLTLNMGGGDELDDTDTVETVTISEDAGLVANLSGISSLTTISASTSTANNDLTVANTVTSLTAGSGADEVEYTGALAADATVVLGAGDDTFTAAAANNATSSVDAGEGNDTLALANATDADTAAEADVYSNFEALEVGGGQGTYELDLLGLTDIKISSDVAAGVVLNDVAAGASVTATATASTDLNITTDAVEYVLEDATGTSDAVTVNLNAVDGDDDGTTTEGEVTLGEFIANDIEKVTVASNALTVDADDESTTNTDESTTTDEYINTVSVLKGDAIKTLELTGNAQAVVTVGADDAGATTVDNTVVTQVDASENTAGVTVNMSTLDDNADVVVNTTAVTFKGSEGDDTYVASHNGDIIQGNGGADTVYLSDNGEINNDGTDGALTLGAATNADETVRFVAASDSQLTLTDTNDDGDADTATGYDVIENFGTAGTDIIELSSSLGLATGDARSDIVQKGSFTAGVANLEDFIGDGVDFFDTGLVDRAVAFATDGTDGYAFVDANGDGDFTQGDDMFIELSGVTTLAVSDVSFG
ncbi:protein of unknown function [Ectothiorhodospira mobilis]|uniref:DUF4214 domain-containing protein n=2 Tax=Ectothiorhodospira mobilis TaxID=195064 RepID=A0A1I4SJH9_ECTMO|nr:protein of unknown function [Ectothiorhodospira mobilis]